MTNTETPAPRPGGPDDHSPRRGDTATALRPPPTARYLQEQVPPRQLAPGTEVHRTRRSMPGTWRESTNHVKSRRGMTFCAIRLHQGDRRKVHPRRAGGQGGE